MAKSAIGIRADEEMSERVGRLLSAAGFSVFI